MKNHHVQADALLTPGEVAALFRVDPKTVTRWAQAGKLSSIRTLGGHRRFLESEVRSLMQGVEREQPGGVPEQVRAMLEQQQQSTDVPQQKRRS